MTLLPSSRCPDHTPLPVRLAVSATICVLFSTLVAGAAVLWLIGLVDPETRRAMGGGK